MLRVQERGEGIGGRTVRRKRSREASDSTTLCSIPGDFPLCPERGQRILFVLLSLSLHHHLLYLPSLVVLSFTAGSSSLASFICPIYFRSQGTLFHTQPPPLPKKTPSSPFAPFQSQTLIHSHLLLDLSLSFSLSPNLPSSCPGSLANQRVQASSHPPSLPLPRPSLPSHLQPHPPPLPPVDTPPPSPQESPQTEPASSQTSEASSSIPTRPTPTSLAAPAPPSPLPPTANPPPRPPPPSSPASSPSTAHDHPNANPMLHGATTAVSASSRSGRETTTEGRSGWTCPPTPRAPATEPTLSQAPRVRQGWVHRRLRRPCTRLRHYDPGATAPRPPSVSKRTPHPLSSQWKSSIRSVAGRRPSSSRPHPPRTRNSNSNSLTRWSYGRRTRWRGNHRLRSDRRVWGWICWTRWRCPRNARCRR